MTQEMIREVEAAREQAMGARDDPANQPVKALCKLWGLDDNFAAVLAKEVFYRTFNEVVVECGCIPAIYLRLWGSAPHQPRGRSRRLGFAGSAPSLG
jgi:transposase